MTLSTSDIDKKYSGLRKTALAYLEISAFCAVFALIYETFSHGVYSSHMIFAFLYPLIGGVFPFYLLYRLKPNPPSSLTLNIYHAGIAAITVGSIVKGILEIYGTTNVLSEIYYIAGIVQILIGAVTYIIDTVRTK